MENTQIDTEDETDYGAIIDKLADMLNECSPLVALSALTGVITLMIAEYAPDERQARKSLEGIAAIILTSGSAAISERYEDEEEDLPPQ